ncbi:hypothetical protein [Sphingomonas sp. PAMC 26617]|uniref:hypothetical protein n=1 Tax=Sphingomonas sp. PAMC 26617 TaxID=1112216 RepID=UPI000496277F|nr:hypothetical protein [Sphingomonas sp. PAMC 26617]
MHRSNDVDRTPPTETFRGSMLFLTFGLVMLAFLVAIDRPEWFKLRPVSGTAIAMAKAAELADKPTAPSPVSQR